MRGQISTESQSSLRNFGGNPVSTGYFDNETVAYTIVLSNQKIKFVDHVEIQSGGTYFILTEETEIGLASVGGFLSTDYYYVVYE